MHILTTITQRYEIVLILTLVQRFCIALNESTVSKIHSKYAASNMIQDICSYYNKDIKGIVTDG